ncbi:MAG: hypothetical protein EA384_06245 [Spirochaetaceae bacterium]|nr:MAG: hypothetical protein EA384_06245 [Spirochaetaceae bacterium]
MELSEALLRVVDACNEARIVYGLAGGFAFSVYCEPRATYDIDLMISAELATVERAVGVRFSSVYRNLESMQYPLIEVSRLLLIEREQEFVLDVLTPRTRELAREFASGVRSVPFAGREVRVLSAELLWLLKHYSTRAQDRLDAEQLRSVIDESAAASLARRFGSL